MSLKKERLDLDLLWSSKKFSKNLCEVVTKLEGRSRNTNILTFKFKVLSLIIEEHKEIPVEE